MLGLCKAHIANCVACMSWPHATSVQHDEELRDAESVSELTVRPSEEEYETATFYLDVRTNPSGNVARSISADGSQTNLTNIELAS